MSKRWIAGLAWIPMVALLGCAEEAGEMDAGTEEPATAEAPADGAAGDPSPVGDVLQVDMESRNESGVDGEVELGLGTAGLMVTIDLEGVEAGTEYASHIHSGNCEEPGGVVVPLESVPGAEGSSTTSVGADQLPPGQSYLVMSHGAGGQPVACADFPEDWRAQLGAGGATDAAGAAAGGGEDAEAGSAPAG